MRRINPMLIFGIFFSILPQYGIAQDQDPAMKALIKQAQYWQTKKDYARAATIWNKVLINNPTQAEAVYGIAQDDLKKNNTAGVNSALDKLKKMDPNGRYLALLEQDVTLGSTSNMKILSNAQSLAAANKVDEAVGQYNTILAGKEPQGNLALEYYVALGHTNANGWIQARKGLERLSKQYPQDASIKLQLAKILLLKESTRIEGLEQLAQLANNPDVGSEAAEEWRLGLTWYKVPQPNAFPVFEQFLKTHPDDAEIKAQLTAGIEQQKKLALLPNRSVSTQDIRANELLQIANQVLANGDSVGARASLDKSLKLNPDNPWARLEMAKLDLQIGQVKAAKDLMFTMPYRSGTNQADVFFARALFSVEIQDWRAAQDYLDQIPTSDRSRDMKDLQQAIVIREQVDLALMLSKQGRTAEGLAVLEKLVNKHPNSVVAVSLIANAYIELGAKDSGLHLMRTTLALHTPPTPEALLAYAGVLLKAKEDIEVANVLARLEKITLTETERREYRNLLFAYSLRQADELRVSGNYAAAESRLAPLLIERPKDSQVIASLAAVYQASGDNKRALDLYKVLIKNNPKNVDIQLGAARLALQINETAFANQRLEAALDIAPKDPDVLASVARIYQSEGKTREAEQLFEQALAIMQASNRSNLANSQSSQSRNKQFTATTVPTFSGSRVPLPAVSVSTLSVDPVTNKNMVYQTAPANESERLVREDLNEIKQERSPEILLGAQIRNRSGSSGTSKLSDVETPLEIRMPAGDGKAIVQITPASLNTGSSSVSNTSNLSNSSLIGNQNSQTASGVGISMGYQDKGVAVDVGVTPIGFTYSNLTGGVKIDSTLDEKKTLAYTLNLSSRPVTDSLLSFSGSKDSASGTQWGGVMASGGRLGLSKDLGGYGFYGAAALHSVNGYNVQSNTRDELGTGFYVNVLQRPDSELTSGLSFTYLSYKNNLSNFSYGQGGYFSPQHYDALMLPITWSAKSASITYQLRAAVGYQSYSQSASSYFPTDAGLQARTGNQMYGSQSTSGAAYNLAAASEYQVAPKVFIGARGQTDNTATGNWRQWGAGLYFRYSFESIDGPMVMPLKSFASQYGQ